LMMSKLLKIVAVMMIIGMMISVSFAQENKAKEKKFSSKKVERVMKLKDVEVKGEVKKPQAVFFLPRSKFTMEDMIVSESFIEKIVNVVDKE